MRQKRSAYLQVYNDWSILPQALASLKGWIDELIVVDGAYEWMIPFLSAIGRDPTKSEAPLYDVLNESGIPYRAIQQVWPNQVEKRIAGYQACTHDHIFRVDADEIFFPDHDAFDRLLAQGFAVGDMEMPSYLAPGWLVTSGESGSHPRQCFFFDRSRVTAELHLNYLWLVLEADKRPLEGQLPYPIFPEPLAFNAHLTTWRTAQGNTSRSGYYTTNWMRGHGVPWIPELAGRPLESFPRLFDFVTPGDFVRILKLNNITIGKFALEPHERLERSPLSQSQEGVFSDLYARFLGSLQAHNQELMGGDHPFAQGNPIFFDISTRESRDALTLKSKLLFSMSASVTGPEAWLHTLRSSAPLYERTPLRYSVNGSEMEISLPEEAGDLTTLRQVVEVRASADSPDPVQRFRILGDN